MQENRYPLDDREVDVEATILRKRACLCCPIVLFLNPDDDGPRAPVCGIPCCEHPELSKGNGQPLDARNPKTRRYGNWGQADAGWCPLGRWEPEFLKQFEPKEPTEEDTAEAHARTAAGAGRGLKSFAALLKNVPDAEAGDLLAGATANGLPLDVAQKMATERGLALDGDA